MKLLYISNHDLDSHSGVVNKIKGQVKQWRNAGHEVRIFSTAGLKVFNADFEISKQYTLSWFFLRKVGRLRIFLVHFFAFIFARSFSPDIVYSRFFLYSPFLHLILKRHRVIIEINGDDVTELSKSSHVLFRYNNLTRDFIFKNVAGLVGVTQELLHRYEKFGVPSVVISNGIDVASIENVRSVEKIISNGKINIGFSGTGVQPAHGIDKLIPFIRGSSELHLHVVGLSGLDEENLTYYGAVDAKTNLEILKSCEVCISSLGSHRKHISEACPLKSREYVLLGKKVLYAYDDFDMDKINIPGLFLKISNDEKNIENNWIMIKDFFSSRLSDLQSDQIISFGRRILSYEVKEQERLNFFTDIKNNDWK